VLLVEDDEMVDALAVQGADRSFGDRVWPLARGSALR
jgi:hypothetical protein